MVEYIINLYHVHLNIFSSAPIPGAPIPGAPIPSGAPAPLPGLSGLTAIPGSNLPGIPIPGMTKKKKNLVPKARKKMKAFHWDKLKPTDIKKTIWKDIFLDDVVLEFKHNPKSDKKDDTKDDVKLDKKTNNDGLTIDGDFFESQFCKPSKKKKPKKKPNKLSTADSDKKKKKKKVLVSLLSDKRMTNICISLARFKTPNLVIRDAILLMDQEELNLDRILKLITFVPTEEEQDTYKTSNVPESDLDLADKFCYTLRNIYKVGKRMAFWSFKIQFNDLISDERENIGVLDTAYKTLKGDESFKLMMKFILFAGNYMNYGCGRPGNVRGFKLASLDNLSQTKSIDKSESLLSFIVNQCRKSNPKALNFVEPFCETLPGAIEMNIDELKKGTNDIGKQLIELNKFLKEIESKTPKKKPESKSDDSSDDGEPKDTFLRNMRDFHLSARQQFTKLEKYLNDTVNNLCSLSQYFGEKKSNDFEYLKSIYNFSNNVSNIHKAILFKEEQKRKEELKKQREIEKKRKMKEQKQRKKEAKLERKKKQRQLKKLSLDIDANGGITATKTNKSASMDGGDIFMGSNKNPKHSREVKIIRKPTPMAMQRKRSNGHTNDNTSRSISSDHVTRNPSLTLQMLNIISLDDVAKNRSSNVIRQSVFQKATDYPSNKRKKNPIKTEFDCFFKKPKQFLGNSEFKKRHIKIDLKRKIITITKNNQQEISKTIEIKNNSNAKLIKDEMKINKNPKKHPVIIIEIKGQKNTFFMITTKNHDIFWSILKTLI